MQLFDPAKFTMSEAKPLPVILLLDISGSMAGEKVAALNMAVREMLDTFGSQSAQEQSIHVSIITFGGCVHVHTPLTPAAQVKWSDLHADGGTPLGEALSEAKRLIEDRQQIPSRAYRPAVVLVSDGQPTDEWQHSLREFIDAGRSSKCDRMAMAIGADADEKILSEFIAGTLHTLYYAETAAQIHEFFRRATMTVSTRAKSQNPNDIPKESP